MKLLLDTQILLWAAGEPERLSSAARRQLDDPQNELFFSAASLWEITIKKGLGRDDFQVEPRLLRRGLLDNGYVELPITSEHAVSVDTLQPAARPRPRTAARWLSHPRACARLVPHQRLRTPGGTLIVRTDRDSNDLVKIVQPNGTEYVRCHCTGNAEIRLTGKTTTVEHIAPGNYTTQVINAQGKTIARYPVAITEGGAAVAEVRLE